MAIFWAVEGQHDPSLVVTAGLSLCPLLSILIMGDPCLDSLPEFLYYIQEALLIFPLA
jgi:hypothetical protein